MPHGYTTPQRTYNSEYCLLHLTSMCATEPNRSQELRAVSNLLRLTAGAVWVTCYCQGSTHLRTEPWFPPMQTTGAPSPEHGRVTSKWYCRMGTLEDDTQSWKVHERVRKSRRRYCPHVVCSPSFFFHIKIVLMRGYLPILWV